jgi:hypothetical protein
VLMPKYHEIDFFDKLPSRSVDVSPRKKSSKVEAVENAKLREPAYSEVYKFGELSNHLSMRDINYSFCPKVLKVGTSRSLRRPFEAHHADPR